MPVIKVTKPVAVTGTATKLAARGDVAKPTTAPTYPVVIANISGKGVATIYWVGDGDATAYIRVYPDGATTPSDELAGNVPGVISRTFNSSIKIQLEGSGLHSSFSYEVSVDTTVVTGIQ
jgi:hypothetical protein